MKIRVKTFAEIGADEKLEKLVKQQFFPTHIFGEIGESMYDAPVDGDWIISIYNPLINISQEWHVPVELCEVVS